MLLPVKITNMKYLFKIVFCFILLFLLNSHTFAQRVQTDSTTTFEYEKFAVNSDSVLVDELLYGDEKEALVIIKSEGGVYINKPKAKEKKFISADEK